MEVVVVKGEREQYGVEIEVVNREMDGLACGVYELTEGEMGVVEGKG